MLLRSILTCILLTLLFFCICQPSNARFQRRGYFWHPHKKHVYSDADEFNRSKPPAALPGDEWFVQQLNHFSATDHRQFRQRFFTNRQFYAPGAPVFLMLGGEGEASAQWMVTGAWVHYARDNKALLFQLEHRYYGKSRPTSDLSTAELAYLSTEQALADLANFIAKMTVSQKLPAGTKWIAFGCSYTGALAAWLRLKYPHLVHAVISSSGPLLAIADFRQYFEVVGSSLAAYNPQCRTAVGKAIAQVELAMRNPQDLTKQFQLCDKLEMPVKNPWDLSNLLEILSSNIASVVQYNKDNSPRAVTTIDAVCDMMMNKSAGTEVQRLSGVNALLLRLQNQTCLDYKYDKMMVEFRNTSWQSDAADGTRQWNYQECTEFGFHGTSDDARATFGDGFPLGFFYDMCADIFGPQFTRVYQDAGIRRTNENYKGLNLRTTNVIYVHGSVDPWHVLGLWQQKHADMPVVYIQGVSHCATMYEPLDSDMPQLKRARQTIGRFITQVLARE